MKPPREAVELFFVLLMFAVMCWAVYGCDETPTEPEEIELQDLECVAAWDTVRDSLGNATGQLQARPCSWGGS